MEKKIKTRIAKFRVKKFETGGTVGKKEIYNLSDECIDA